MYKRNSLLHKLETLYLINFILITAEKYTEAVKQYTCASYVLLGLLFEIPINCSMRMRYDIAIYQSNCIEVS